MAFDRCGSRHRFENRCRTRRRPKKRKQSLQRCCAAYGDRSDLYRDSPGQIHSASTVSCVVQIDTYLCPLHTGNASCRVLVGADLQLAGKSFRWTGRIHTADRFHRDPLRNGGVLDRRVACGGWHYRIGESCDHESDGGY